MSESNSNRRSKIRTFASDLELAKKRREELKSVEKKVSPPKEIINIPIMPSDAKKPFTSPKPPMNLTVENKKNTHKKIPGIKIIEPTQTTPNDSLTKKIPAFHELQKQVNDIQGGINNEENIAKQEPKKEVVEEPTPSKLNIGYDATVITDTKADRFQLFPSIANSLRAWFKKLTTVKKKEVLTYSVADTERRKGVIQKATSKSATLFTADSDTIRDQIRRRRIEDSIKKEPETTWSPFTDTGYNLLESSNPIQNITVEYKKVLEVPQLETIASEEKPEPVVEIVTEAKETEDDTLAEARWAASKEAEALTRGSLENKFSNKPKEDDAPSETAQVLKSEDLISKPKPNTTSLLKQVDSNTTIVILLVMVVSLLAIIAISKLIIEKDPQTKEPELVSINTEIKTLVPNTTAIQVNINPGNINTLSNIIKSSTETTPAGIIELALIAPDGNELSGSYIFSSLHFRTIPNLRQSLTSVRFLSVNHSQPAILFKFVDLNTVRGGLLQWEPSMPLDMTEMFNVPYGVAPYFSDVEIEGVSSRILTHEDKVVLIYGILDDNTGLIANNIDDYKQIINNISD